VCAISSLTSTFAISSPDEFLFLLLIIVPVIDSFVLLANGCFAKINFCFIVYSCGCNTHKCSCHKDIVLQFYLSRAACLVVYANRLTLMLELT